VCLFVFYPINKREKHTLSLSLSVSFGALTLWRGPMGKKSVLLESSLIANGSSREAKESRSLSLCVWRNWKAWPF